MSSFTFFLLTICTIFLVLSSIPNVSSAQTPSKTNIPLIVDPSMKSENQPAVQGEDEDEDPEYDEIDFDEPVTVRKDIAQKHVAALAQARGSATSICCVHVLLPIATMVLLLLWTEALWKENKCMETNVSHDQKLEFVFFWNITSEEKRNQRRSIHDWFSRFMLYFIFFQSAIHIIGKRSSVMSFCWIRRYWNLKRNPCSAFILSLLVHWPKDDWNFIVSFLLQIT